MLGEKSAGKTESVRLILHFLTNLNKEIVPSANKTNDHTQNSAAATLMRCKSLASYPSPNHELPDGNRTESTKCIRDVDRLRENVEINFTHQYKSLDDVSECHANNKLSQPNTSVTFKPLNQNHNCNDSKTNFTTLLHGEKTPVRTRKLLIAKRDLHQQCERCGYVQLNGNINDNNGSRKVQLSDKERFSNKFVNENAFAKSTNLKKHRSVSTQSLGYRYDSNDDAASRTLKLRIVSSLVLLEAFGNASDHINSNSSRFVSIDQFAINNFAKLKIINERIVRHRDAFLILNWISKETHWPRILAIVSTFEHKQSKSSQFIHFSQFIFQICSKR